MDLLRIPAKLLAIASLTVSTFISIPHAAAQDAPPGRIARVSYSYGNISFSDAGTNAWMPLVANRPISRGDSVFTPDTGRAELQVGANALRLHERTRISFIELNDNNTQIKLWQGQMVFRVRALVDRENFEISTPNLSFSVQEPGEYRINVNEDNTSTIIVRRGVGVAQGDRDIITLREGDRAHFYGTNLNHSQISSAPPFDTFDQWAMDRDRSEENAISARYVPRDVVGYQQLDEYGNWESHTQYGAIWYPRSVTTGWAPYRDGQWVWVAPWGWTWVDRSPWGFAPYHYGRWAFVGRRWGWVPGRYEHHHHAVYAPALVAFVGTGSHSTHISIGSGRGHHDRFSSSVSWVPLGPGEIYRPSYSHNERYLENMNQNVSHRSGHGFDNNYRNHHIPNAVTSVSKQTFVRGDHVFPASQSILSGQIQKIRLATETPNLTPDKANRFGEGRSNHWQGHEQPSSRSDAAQQASLPLTSRPTDQGRRAEMATDNSSRFERSNSNSENRSNGILGNLVKTQSNSGANNQTNALTQTAEGNNNFPQRGRQDDSSNRPNLTNSRLEIQNTAQQLPKPTDQSFERGNERTVERNTDRNVERTHERNIERFTKPTERSGDPTFERTRPVERAMPQMPRMEPRIEPRPEPRMEPRISPPEPKREAPSRAENKPESKQENKLENRHEKDGEKRRFER